MSKQSGKAAQASYTDEQGQRHMIELGTNRVISEWAEGNRDERRWLMSPSRARWQHPRTSDLLDE